MLRTSHATGSLFSAEPKVYGLIRINSYTFGPNTLRNSMGFFDDRLLCLSLPTHLFPPFQFPGSPDPHPVFVEGRVTAVTIVPEEQIRIGSAAATPRNAPVRAQFVYGEISPHRTHAYGCVALLSSTRPVGTHHEPVYGCRGGIRCMCDLSSLTPWIGLVVADCVQRSKN